MSQDRPKPTTVKGPHRSAITNGKLLPGVDGRSTWARRLRDVIQALSADLGTDDLSEADRSVIRRAATLTVELERMEEAFAAKGAADPDEIDLYGRTAGNLRRLLESVGLRGSSREGGFRVPPPGEASANETLRRVAFALTQSARTSPVIDLETT